LSEILVNVGDRVTGGQVIALTGNTDGGTGVSTGPHCHVGCLPPNFNINSNTYGRVNPRIYMTEYYEGDDDMSILDEPIQQVGGGTITLRQQLAEYRPHHIEITNKLDVIAEQTHESMLNDRTQVYALQDVLKNASPVDIAEALNAKQIAREVMDEISKIISA
jgi:murein DD-endopeptidase MepM/ murein hydrolase activator NlpD